MSDVLHRGRAAGRTTVELVMGSFERVLGPDLIRAPIGADDDFFALGGDSALAALAVIEIEDQCGISLPANLLFDAPTPSAVAAAIELGGAAGASDCVLLKPASTDDATVPLFLVPGIDGFARSLLPLARQIDLQGAVYGLQTPGLDGRVAPLDNIAALAAHHVASIRRVHPRGEFGLLGYSLGGLVVLEMAHELQSFGRAPGVLIVLDSTIPRRQRSFAATLTVWARRGRQRLRALFTHDDARPRVRPDVDVAHANDWAKLAEPMRSVNRASWRAARAYRPRRYSGRVLFIAADSSDYLTYPDILWHPLAGQLDIIEVPGTHRSVVRRYAASTAAAIGAAARASGSRF